MTAARKLTARGPSSWQLAAACRDQPQQLWPEPATHQALPCRECPVRAECLQEGLAQRVQTGIWGGFTAAERRAYLHTNRPVQLIEGAA